MGNLLSYLWTSTGRTDDPDPVTGLTSRDRYLIQTSWKKASSPENSLETGTAMFLAFFEKHPRYQQLFPFKDLPREKLRDSYKFKAHCTGVMFAFSSIVDSIEDMPLLEQILLRQGINHVPRHVENQSFTDFKDVLLELFSKTMTDEEVASWKKFLDLGFGLILKGANEAKN